MKGCVGTKGYISHGGKTDEQKEPGTVMTNLKLPPAESFFTNCPDGFNKISQVMHLLLKGENKTADSTLRKAR